MFSDIQKISEQFLCLKIALNKKELEIWQDNLKSPSYCAIWIILTQKLFVISLFRGAGGPEFGKPCLYNTCTLPNRVTQRFFLFRQGDKHVNSFSLMKQEFHKSRGGIISKERKNLGNSQLSKRRFVERGTRGTKKVEDRYDLRPP